MQLETFLQYILGIEIGIIIGMGSIISLNLLILLLRSIYRFLRMFGSWENLKIRFIDFIKWFQQQDFHYYIDLANLVLIAMALFTNIKRYFILIYLPLYLIARILIIIVGGILKTKKNGISEFKFLVYLISFALVIIGYIVSFSLFYSNNFSLNYGYISDGNNHVKLSTYDAILYSGYTFFTMSYKNFQPEGIFTWLTLTEVFIAQILIIMFIGIIAGKIIENLKLN